MNIGRTITGRSWIRGIGVVVLVALAPLLFSQRPADRIFAMADIHGNYDSAIRLLRRAGLIDEDDDWIRRRGTFIQTGDYTDRGPQVRRVLDLLMSLEDDAPRGSVEVLLGNHEMMNILGDLRDVTETDYASFRDSRSERRRRSAFDDYVDFTQDRAERLDLPDPEFTSEMESEWMAAHPPGFVEHREAFSKNGRYGKWLRERPVVVIRRGVVFLHAGISPMISDLSIDQVNARVHEEIRTFDEIREYLVDKKLALPFFTLQDLLTSAREELEARELEISQERREAEDRGRTYQPSERDQGHIEILEVMLGIGGWLSMHPDGVLWFRGYARWDEEEGAPQIEQLLEKYDAEHFVVGHTPQLGEIAIRFGGSVFLADTGMSLTSLGGRASILELRDGVFRGIYLD